MSRAMLLHPDDTVAVLVENARAGDWLELQGNVTVPLRNTVPGGHKVAVQVMRPADPVIKYGYVIGKALCHIQPGEWVHNHNMATTLAPDSDFGACGDAAPTADTDVFPATTFMGYVREQGRAGIRNDLWIIPTVGCINGELEALARTFSPPPWITGVKVLSHPYGCSQLGEDLLRTTDALVGLACNPNAAGVVIVGLGCENLHLERLRSRLSMRRNVGWAKLQDVNGAETLLAGLHRLADAAPRIRTVCSVCDLVMGVKCGGSDGYSGLTANPLVGRVADRLIRVHGVTLATEIPEMFGAEPALLPRMTNAVRNDFLSMNRWFRDYFTAHGQPIYENPSPGNREGGISTLEEKSFGAVEKSGSSPIVNVLPYGGQVASGSGVQITFAPGNDLVSCTALAASGAQIILFTTGRGTPFGSVIPTLKIASNSELARSHPQWIDFDAGRLLTDGRWNMATDALCAKLLTIVNGELAAHETRGIAQIAIFKDGVTL